MPFSMLFSNPNVIKDIYDVIIGCIKTNKDKISHLEYKVLLKRKILKLVVNAVDYQMTFGLSREKAIQAVADSMYSFIRIDEKFYPLNEEEIVEQILISIQFQSWETKIYYRFLAIHKGVVSESTPIEVGGRISEYEGDYETDYSFDDFLQAISSCYNT